MGTDNKILQENFRARMKRRHMVIVREYVHEDDAARARAYLRRLRDKANARAALEKEKAALAD